MPEVVESRAEPMSPLYTALEGSWDLEAAYNWAYALTYNPPEWPYRRPYYK